MHAAVVLLPLAAIATVVVAAIPSARRHSAPVVFGAALVATVAVGLAQQSGNCPVPAWQPEDNRRKLPTYSSRGREVTDGQTGVVNGTPPPRHRGPFV